MFFSVQMMVKYRFAFEIQNSVEKRAVPRFEHETDHFVGCVKR